MSSSKCYWQSSRYALLMFVLSFGVLPTVVRAQTSPAPRVELYQKEGSAIGGLLLGVGRDSLTIASNHTVRIARSNIDHIIVLPSTSERSGFLVGGTALSYLGCASILSANGQPAVFLWNAATTGEIGAVLGLGFLLGGAAGALFDNAEPPEMDFILNSPDGDANWLLLQDFFAHRSFAKRIHLSVYLGHTGTPATEQLDKAATKSGYVKTISDYYNYFDYNYDRNIQAADEFNMMRRIELTYTLRPDVEVGVALANLGEPTHFWQHSELDSTGSFRPFHQMHQSLFATGYLAEASYKHLLNPRSPRVELLGGVGLGVAHVTFNRELDSSFYYYSTPGAALDSYDFDEVEPLVMVMLQARIFAMSNFSVSLYGDYALLAGPTVSAFPIAGIPEQHLNISNGSYGFSIDYHF
jgi:hypothetical protein